MDSQSNTLARTLPFSLEAEQSLLGSILIDPECFKEIASIVKSDDFYLDEHAQIYLAMQDLFLHSKNTDVVTLIDTLVKRGVYGNDDDGRRYIKLIADAVPTASNVKDYAMIVRDKSMLRQLISACDEINEDAYSASGETRAILDNAEQKIFAIAQQEIQKGFVHIRDALVTAYENIKKLSEDSDYGKGIPTGFSDLDRVLVGMGPGDLILVGARPGMGKTSFAMNIATNVARKTNKAVAVFSLEMSVDQLVSRMLSSEAMINSYDLRKGTIKPDQWDNLAHASAALSECDIYIDDTTGIGVTAMKAKLRRVKNLGLVVIDYLQLMQSDKRIDNRVQEVAEISRNLKLLAKDLGVPLITCAQLSRGPESRTDKRPMLSDLRDSGAIEQDADIVMFLYRDEYYKEDANSSSVAEVIVAKNRHGETKNVKMGWIPSFTKFVTLDTREEGK